MTGRRDPLVRAQRDLYKSQRALGDLNALRRSPQALTRRLVRRSITRRGFQLLGRWGR